MNAQTVTKCPKCGSEMEKEDYIGDACWWCDSCHAYYPRHEEKVETRTDWIKSIPGTIGTYVIKSTRRR